MESLFSAFGGLELPGQSILLGFSAYTLFIVWRRLAARWINWFPLAAKLTRFVLYVVAISIAILAVAVFGDSSFSLAMIPYLVGGLAIAPGINALSRVFRKKEKVRRGTKVADAATVNRMVMKLPKAEVQQPLRIGGVAVPFSSEQYHFFIVGSTGTGKSVLITQLLDIIEARGDTVIMVDSGGDFTKRYYRPERDYIINPFDDRCVPWSPTAELAGPWDAEGLAKSMIPDGVGDSKEWNGYAQTLLKEVLARLMTLNKMSIRDLLYYCQAAPIEELSELLQNTSAAAFLTNERTFGSIRTIVTSYLSTYAYLEDNDDPFSITKFINNPKPGFLFFAYQDNQLDSLRNMISCAIDVAARNIMSLPDNESRRIWIIIDEFASIGKVQSIEMVATKARKKGCCLMLGLQSISQLKDRYGELGAQTIMSCLNTWTVLRCTDSETAEQLSKFIGETELSRMTRGESSSETGGSASLNEQIQTQRAVMPIELQQLANLHGFLKLRGEYPVCQIKVEFPERREPRTVQFQARDFRARPMLSLAPKAAATAAATTVASAGGAGGFNMAVPEAAAATPTALEAEPMAPERSALVVQKSVEDVGPEFLEEFLNELAAEFEF